MKLMEKPLEKWGNSNPSYTIIKIIILILGTSTIAIIVAKILVFIF